MRDLDSRHFDELAALLAVASEGSFVGAGQLLQRDATIVPKRLAALERRLGVRLLERTTKRVRLTEAGARLAERLRSAESLILEAETEASAGTAELRGKLRLALPAAMGRLWIAPLLPSFLLRYPALEVEVDYSERYVDIVAEGFDAAVRVGILSDSRLIAKRLGNHRRVVCAAPDYVRCHGAPATPRELAGHNLPGSGSSSGTVCRGTRKGRPLPPPHPNPLRPQGRRGRRFSVFIHLGSAESRCNTNPR